MFREISGDCMGHSKGIPMVFQDTLEGSRCVSGDFIDARGFQGILAMFQSLSSDAESLGVLRMFHGYS